MKTVYLSLTYSGADYVRRILHQQGMDADVRVLNTTWVVRVPENQQKDALQYLTDEGYL